jgi:hypothetical protein
MQIVEKKTLEIQPPEGLRASPGLQWDSFVIVSVFRGNMINHLNAELNSICHLLILLGD